MLAARGRPNFVKFPVNFPVSFAKPISDLRGANMDDIVTTCAVGLTMG
jgi:hypothetical protein